MIRAVIFDFNGVIVDDEHLHFLLFRDVLAGIGVALSEDRYHADYLGFDDRGCLASALRDAGRAADPSLVDALILDKARRYIVAAEADLHFFPAAGAIIPRMAEIGPVVICSGALRGEIEFALRRLGILDRVAGIVSAEDTTACKPDPQGYLRALELLRTRLGDLGAAECLVVEDSLAGVEAARAAGMTVVGVSNTYAAEELRAAGAIRVIGTLDELPATRDELGLPTALLYSRDLIFTSKITGTAAALSRKVHVAGGVERAAAIADAHPPALLLIDLTAGVTAESLASLRALAPRATSMAFGPHVDVSTLDLARRAGIEHVLPRSKFAAELPDILRRYLVPSGD